MNERKRAVYLSELDWNIVTACLLDRSNVDRSGLTRPYQTIWNAGASRARYIVDVINKSDQSGPLKTGEQKE